MIDLNFSPCAERSGEMKVEPAAKRPRRDSDSEGEGEGEMRSMEESSDLQDRVSGAPMVEVHSQLTEVADAEKKAVQLRAGKSLEERQRQFKEMLLERGVRCMYINLSLSSSLSPPSFLLPSIIFFPLSFPSSLPNILSPSLIGISLLHLGERTSQVCL